MSDNKIELNEEELSKIPAGDKHDVDIPKGIAIIQATVPKAVAEFIKRYPDSDFDYDETVDKMIDITVEFEPVLEEFRPMIRVIVLSSAGPYLNSRFKR